MRGARLLVVDDEKLIRWSLQRELSKKGFNVNTVETGEEALGELDRSGYQLVLLDVKLPGSEGLEVLKQIKESYPDLPVVMITAFAEVDAAVRSLKLGAYDYIRKPFNIEELCITIQRAIESSSLRNEVHIQRLRERQRFSAESIVGDSEAIRQVRELVTKLAEGEARTILLEGESGTGKELVARVLHYSGSRVNRPFVAINCPALPENLLESELMGHVRGAFTDAKHEKRGLFEIADGGTVLLDEIGDMPISMQGKILRLIEDKSFRRVGGLRDIVVDVTVIASTNKDLARLVEEEKFRADLYYRLNVFPIRLPPLREHREDIPLLVQHFVRELSVELRRSVRGFSESAVRALVEYDWPGNVRELRNVVERMTILYAGKMVELEDLPADIRDRRPLRVGSRQSFRIPPGGISLHELEADLVRQALEVSSGNQTRAAQLLGISRDALRNRMRKYGLSLRSNRT